MGEGEVYRIKDGKHLCQIRDAEDTFHLIIWFDEDKRSIDFFGAFKCTYHDGQPSRVYEVDELQVENEVGWPKAHLLGDGVPQLGSTVDVDVAARLDDSPAISRLTFDLELLHRFSMLPLPDLLSYPSIESRN